MRIELPEENYLRFENKACGLAGCDSGDQNACNVFSCDLKGTKVILY